VVPLIKQTAATKSVRVISAVIGLLAVAYVLFVIYRVYFFHPHGRGDSSSALLMILITVLLAAMTIEFARSERRRSLGVCSNAWKLRAFAVILIVFPVLVSPLSPTTLVFFFFAIILLFSRSLYGISRTQFPEN
jgi:hypothetical protein